MKHSTKRLLQDIAFTVVMIIAAGALIAYQVLHNHAYWQ